MADQSNIDSKMNLSSTPTFSTSREWVEDDSCFDSGSDYEKSTSWKTNYDIPSTSSNSYQGPTPDSSAKRRKIVPIKDDECTVLLNVKNLDFSSSHNNCECGDDQLWTQPKNTNNRVHTLNRTYNKMCIICDKKTSSIVSHYTQQHPEAEVFIARPSPKMAAEIRKRNHRSYFDHKDKLHALCYFCGMEKALGQYYWPLHLLAHTGECTYYCESCKEKVQTKSAHSACPSTSIKSNCALNIRYEDFTAFMCNLCNYIQINENGLIAHLLNEHEIARNAISSKYEQIILLSSGREQNSITPKEQRLTDGKSETVIFNIKKENELNDTNNIEFKPVIVSLKHKFVNESILYRCDKVLCDRQFSKLENFRRHFVLSNIHKNNTEFVCPHCDQKITSENQRSISFDDILSHLSLHSTRMYGCGSCEFSHYYELDVITHFSETHSDQQMAIYRPNENVVERISFTFACNVCNETFEQVIIAKSHFKQRHRYQTVDIKVIQLINVVGTGAKGQLHENIWYLRQIFVCNICEQTECTKSQMVEHHIQNHAVSYLQFKRTKTMWLSHKALKNPGELAFENAAFDRSIVYTCMHCDEINPNNTKNVYTYKTIKHLHLHWISAHSFSQTNEKCFQFCVKKLIACFYCNVISTFAGIKAHHRAMHGDYQFVTVNETSNQRCGLCECECQKSDWYVHYKEVHGVSVGLSDQLDEPCDYLDDEFIENLLRIDLLKKRQCGHCGSVLETVTEFNEHHSQNHIVLKPNFKLIDDRRRTFLAGCCDNRHLISEQDLNDHMRTHRYLQCMCSICHIDFDELDDMVYHLKHTHNLDNTRLERSLALSKRLFELYMAVKVVFGNGLVLSNSSLSATKYSEIQNIRVYVSVPSN